MTGPRNTSAVGGRGNVTLNGNRRHYGDPARGPGDHAGREATFFSWAHQQIDGNADRLHGPLHVIEAEVARGADADGAAVAGALRTIAQELPEFAEALAAGLLDPSAGVAVPVQSAARWALEQKRDARSEAGRVSPPARP